MVLVLLQVLAAGLAGTRCYYKLGSHYLRLLWLGPDQMFLPQGIVMKWMGCTMMVWSWSSCVVLKPVEHLVGALADSCPLLNPETEDRVFKKLFLLSFFILRPLPGH